MHLSKYTFPDRKKKPLENFRIFKFFRFTDLLIHSIGKNWFVKTSDHRPIVPDSPTHQPLGTYPVTHRPTFCHQLIQ